MTTATAPTATAFGARFLTPLVIGTLLNAVNSSMIAVTLVPIGRDLGVGATHTVWLVTVLYLTTAAAQPVMGRVVDTVGARRVLTAGLVMVIAAGLLGAFAPTFGVLLASRILLGLGTATGFPAAMAMLRARATALDLPTPSRALSVIATSTQASMAVGPTLGSLLVGVGDWRWTFAVNVPVAAAGLILTLRWLPADEHAARSGPRPPLDLLGIGLFTLTLTTLLLLLMGPGELAWAFLGTGLLAGIGLVVRELRVRDPFLDFRALAANRPLTMTYLRQGCGYLVIYAFLYGYPQWLAQSHGLPESAIGLAMLPMSVTTVALSAFGARLGGSVRTRLLLTAGALLAGSVALLPMSAGTAIGLIVAVGLLFGVGQGLSTVANQTVLYAQAPQDRIGTLSGLFRTSQYLGALASTSVLAATYGHQATDSGLGNLALVLTVVAVGLLIVTVADRTLRTVR
nr:MFS transporter [Kibdelosporangium sp. MJ126-NF4]CEL15559.1 drug resistance transporter, EmrB/QacA family protein, putative [Kibdelosporangium sp. MJ126-NF4]CTQ98224.1 drug resistance transporter, EmrB/QacA family protein, putative [Kibdelosporangium sp. MJ126-NF4]